MKIIRITIYCCGMSDELFSDKIMLYKPHRQFSEEFFIEDDDTKTKLSDIIHALKDRVEFNGDAYLKFALEQICVDRLYIQTQDALWGITKDHLVSSVFSYWDSTEISLCYFLVGGASIHQAGYMFIVHPNEDIHKHTPHVHVRRDNEETRYRLDTLERFPNDTVSRRFLKDEKKIIKPYLKQNQTRLMDFWNKYMDGYIPPTEDIYGQQYYQES